MYTAISIANFFIQKGIEHGKPVDQMKVQKLVYFAHGWYLAITNDPLINEAIEAWQFGPVIPSLYHALKLSGNRAIVDTIRLNEQLLEIDNEFLPYLESIWNLYSPFTGIQLSNMTHEGDTPWAKISKEFNDQIPSDKAIDNELIKHYFQSLKNKTAQP